MERCRGEGSNEAGSRPSFSIVVVTHEREHLFRQAFASIEKAVEEYPGEAEIVIVNSSRTNALESTPERVTEIHVPDADKSTEKRNLGLQEAINDWIVYVDDDCTVADRALRVAAPLIEDAEDRVAGLYPVTEFVGDRDRPFECCHGTHYTSAFSMPKRGTEQTWGPCTLAIFDREALLAVGGFDESFASGAGGEDIDIGLRLTERGYRLVGIPETLVYHTTATWNSFRGNCRRFFEYGRGEAELKRKHPGRTHFKLNTVSLLAIVAVTSTITTVIAWGRTGLLLVPLFACSSMAINAGYYRRRYDKPFGQALLLRAYDYANAVGNVANADGEIHGVFYRLKPSLDPDAPYPLGRERLVYSNELLDYVPLLLTYLAIYLLVAY